MFIIVDFGCKFVNTKWHQHQNVSERKLIVFCCSCCSFINIKCQRCTLTDWNVNGSFLFCAEHALSSILLTTRNNFHNFFCFNAKFTNCANHLWVPSASLCCIQNKFTMRRQELIESGRGVIKIIGWEDLHFSSVIYRCFSRNFFTFIVYYGWMGTVHILMLFNLLLKLFIRSLSFHNECFLLYLLIKYIINFMTLYFNFYWKFNVFAKANKKNVINLFSTLKRN